MPTYSLKAPNGKMYSIEGPAGASEDDVRAEVLRRDPSAGQAPQENVFQRAARLGTEKFGKASDAFNRDASAAIDAQKDQGSFKAWDPRVLGAPVVDAIQGAMAYPEGVLDATFGDKPVALPLGINSKGLSGGDIAGLAMPLGGAAVRGGAKVLEAAKAGDAAASVGATVKNITQAGRRATAASDAMRADIYNTTRADQGAAAVQASVASDKAARAAALAARAKARSGTLAARSADAASAAEPPPLEIGDARHLSDLGEDIRTPALENQADIEGKMREADQQYRSAMDAVASDRAASGVGISDTDAGKAIIAKSKALVEPDPVARPDVGYTPADSAGGKLHSMVLDALEPKKVDLTIDQAKQAVQSGIEVTKRPDGSLYRVVKPDLQTADNLRRFLGKVLDGSVEGYEAINRTEASSLYKDVSTAIDQYVGGASKPVQENWAAGKKALEPFERVRAGKAVVGLQNGTDTAAVPAANIPGRIVSGGRDTVQQTAAIAGKEPVASVLRSQVQNTLSGVKGSDAVAKAVAPGTKLGDAMSSEPDLVQAVTDYINKTKTAETNAALAKDLTARAGTNADRAAKFSKHADALQGTAQSSADLAGQYQRELANLEIADPKDVPALYKSMLDRAHKAGTVDINRYQDGLRLAQTAQQDFALKATRDKWTRNAAITLGLGSLPLGIGHVVAGRIGR